MKPFVALIADIAYAENAFFTVVESLVGKTITYAKDDRPDDEKTGKVVDVHHRIYKEYSFHRVKVVRGEQHEWVEVHNIISAKSNPLQEINGRSYPW